MGNHVVTMDLPRGAGGGDTAPQVRAPGAALSAITMFYTEHQLTDNNSVPVQHVHSCNVLGKCCWSRRVALLVTDEKAHTYRWGDANLTLA